MSDLGVRLSIGLANGSGYMLNSRSSDEVTRVLLERLDDEDSCWSICVAVIDRLDCYLVNRVWCLGLSGNLWYYGLFVDVNARLEQ